MARNLYRVYLYVVSIGSLIIASVGVYALLGLLFAQTPLRGTGSPAPTSDEVIQRVVLGVVLLVVAGALGGLHYWLMRRDMRSDPEAGTGAIRSFFLNGVEAVAVIVAVSVTVGVLNGIAYGPDYGNAAEPLAIALAVFAVAATLELERRRTRAGPGAARIFERLHLHGTPLVILLTSGVGVWIGALQQTTSAILYSAGQLPVCQLYVGGPCYSQQALIPLWGSVLLVAAVWAAYAFAVRSDLRSALRQVFHLLGLTVGVIFAVIGVERGIQLGMRGLLGGPVSWSDLVGGFDFVSLLLFGLVVALAYGLWLRFEAERLPMGAMATGLTSEAIAAAAFSVPFWWGLGYVLSNALERMVGQALPDQYAWATASALAITGLVSIPVIVDLHLRTIRTGVSGPHRSFALGSLAAGALAGAVGAAIALYALGTNLLGAQLANWEVTARTGAVVLVIGAVIAAIYGWVSLSQHYFKSGAAPAPAQASAAPTPAPTSVEAVLDALAAGKVTREEAAAQIHEIDHRPMIPA